MNTEPPLAAFWLQHPVELLRVTAEDADGFFRAKASNDGARIMARHGDGLMQVWEVGSGSTPAHEASFSRFQDAEKSVTEAAASALRGRALWSPDGSKIAVVCSDKVLAVWNLDVLGGTVSSGPFDITHGHQDWPDLAWAPNSMQIATWLPAVSHLRRCRVGGGHKHKAKVVLFSACHGGPEPVQLDHTGLEVRGVAYSPDGTMLVSWCARQINGQAGPVLLWNLLDVTAAPTDCSLSELQHGNAQVCHVAWSPNAMEFATIRSDGKVHVWNACALDTAPLQLDTGFSTGLDTQHIGWSPKGSRVVCSPMGGGVHVCGADADDTLLFELNFGSVMTDKALWAPESRRAIFPGTRLEQLPPPQVWELHQGSGRAPVELRHSNISEAMPTFESVRCWSPDGLHIVVMSYGTRRLLDRSQQEQASEVWVWYFGLNGHSVSELTSLRNLQLHDLSWSPDSRLIVAASVHGTAHIIAALGGSELCTLGQKWNHGFGMDWAKGAVSARFLPCGRRITCTTRGTHVVGDSEDGDSICVFGPQFNSSAYKLTMETLIASGGLHPNSGVALHSAERILKALEIWCDPGEEKGLQQMLHDLEKHASAASTSHQDVLAVLPTLPPIERANYASQLQAEAIWSFCEEVKFCGRNCTFSWLLNFIIDVDDPILLEAAALFMLCLDAFSLRVRHSDLSPVCWPVPDSASGIMRTWRIGGFNEVWSNHFIKGTRHHVAGYVATMRECSAAWSMISFASDRQEAVVEWCYEITEDCQHLLYLNNGQEFVLKPYTVVEVIDVEWQALDQWPYTMEKTTPNNPHRIRLRVEPDFCVDSLDLPIAPWC